MFSKLSRSHRTPPVERHISLDRLKKSRHSVFACGADMKNRFSFFKGGRIYFSGDNGDLSLAENFIRYLDKIKSNKSKLGLSPDIVAYDPHPLYFSSRAAQIFNGAKKVAVQHHHAHVAAMLAAGKKSQVIGVSFDGTGYGLDGNLWGGEFLVVSSRGFRRAGHLKYLKMPAGEAAIREPWRLAFSLLYEHLGDKIFSREYAFLKVEKRDNYFILQNIIDKNINVFLSSSCGRLFDAVSSLLGITQRVNFEAEAAINLEKEALQSIDSAVYAFDILRQDSVYIVDYKGFLDQLLFELESGVERKVIARRFHNSLAALIVEMVKLISNDSGLKDVCLSGGVFQNRLLYCAAVDSLKKEGFTILEDKNVPVNDLGICIGQTYAALNGVGGRE